MPERTLWPVIYCKGQTEANIVGPDQTAPRSTLFLKEASRTLQQMTNTDYFYCDLHFNG